MKKKEILFIATSNFFPIKKKQNAKLKKMYITVKYNPYKRKMTENEIISKARNAKYIIAGTENYNKITISKLTNLKVLFRLGSGTDNVDLKFLNKNKIKFFKSKTTPEKAVAELIVLYILSIYRNIIEHNLNLKNKLWKKKTGLSLFGKTVGIIGYGKVGKYLKKILKNFGVNFLLHDVKKISNNSTINKILKNSDIISLNLSSKDKKCLIDRDKFKLIKKKPIIINTSRPEVIDYECLFQNLKKKKILGAALDVFKNEPYKGKFTKLNNVILTPHIAGSTKEVRQEMENEAIDTLIKIINKK